MAQKNVNTSGDIHDSKRDEKYLEQEETTIDLPDVEDIPGQENIRVPKMKEMMDTTISSGDEEGEGLFDDEDEDTDSDADVSYEEKELLKRSSESMASEDDEAVRKSKLDNIDDEGENLNESIDLSGQDLDVPGAELDDDNEEIGEEDEENNFYSQGQG